MDKLDKELDALAEAILRRQIIHEDLVQIEEVTPDKYKLILECLKNLDWYWTPNSADFVCDLDKKVKLMLGVGGWGSEYEYQLVFSKKKKKWFLGGEYQSIYGKLYHFLFRRKETEEANLKKEKEKENLNELLDTLISEGA